MYNLYNLQAKEQLENFLTSYRNYLSSEKVSSITVRSYVSDARFFLKWFLPFMASSVKSPSNINLIDLLKQVSKPLLEQFSFYLISQEIPLKSINRKYSALRKLGTFCQVQNLFAENIFDDLKNLTVNVPFPEQDFHLNQFKDQLLKNKVSPNTVKNYLADIKQFLSWQQNIN